MYERMVIEINLIFGTNRIFMFHADSCVLS